MEDHRGLNSQWKSPLSLKDNSISVLVFFKCDMYCLLQNGSDKWATKVAAFLHSRLPIDQLHVDDCYLYTGNLLNSTFAKFLSSFEDIVGVYVSDLPTEFSVNGGIVFETGITPVFWADKSTEVSLCSSQRQHAPSTYVSCRGFHMCCTLHHRPNGHLSS